jgi:hypothetical protein
LVKGFISAEPPSSGKAELTFPSRADTHAANVAPRRLPSIPSIQLTSRAAPTLTLTASLTIDKGTVSMLRKIRASYLNNSLQYFYKNAI